MKELLAVLWFICASYALAAQSDTVNSPFSVYGGAGTGGGILLGGQGELPNGYDDLQYGQSPYLDVQFKAGMLWKEKFGVVLLAGQLGRINDGSNYFDYAESAVPGYKFLPEYSDLHSGYRYRYFAPQFVYRWGREPFNLTLNAGIGIGSLRSANGIAMYQKDSSNYFLEMRYYAEPSWNMNFAVGVDLAYMRQLTQHWFMNTGVNIGYTAIKQNYDITSTTQSYQQQFPLQSPSHIESVLHHLAVGVFMHFQWNTKEYARAYYE